jgi:alpha-L-arabinofuranosidase
MNLHIAQHSETSGTTRKRIHTVLAAAALCLLPAGSAWSQTTSAVTVNAASVSATVPPEGYGLNTYVFDGNMLSSGVASAVQSSGVTALRYPGGSDSDVFNFITGTEQSMNDGAYWYSGDTFANFMSQLAQPEGGTPVITVNYGSNVTNSGPALPSEAASWVQYANVTNNYGIVYWEIGNETYGNGYYNSWDWEYDLHDLDQTAADRVGNSALSPTAYGTNAAAFVQAMKAVDPSIKCGISVNTSQYSPGWDQAVFQGISAALSGTGLYPDFVIVHWYPSGTNAQILATQATIPATVAQIRSDLKSYYTLSNVNEMQILVTETGPGNLTTVGGGILPFLFASDDYLTWFENGASNVDYQDLHQGYLEEPGDGNEASSGDDYTTPYGPWYGVSLDSTVARVGDSMVAATSTNALLRAHAIQRTDGQTGVVLINQDPTNNTAVTVNISGVMLASTGTQYNFGNANFASSSWTASSEISESAITGVGNSFTVTVPAYSVTAVLIPSVNGSSFLLSNNGNITLAGGATSDNTSTITVSPSGGFSGAVAMTCAVTSPTGATSPATCSLASSSVASGSGTDVLTVATTSTTTAGAYSVLVTGTSGALTQTTTVTVTVTPPPSIALTNSGSITLTSPGATTGNTSTITVTPSGGFTGAVAMTCAITSSPSGAIDLPTCGLATPSVTISGATAQTDVLTLNTTAATTSLNKPANPFWHSTGGAVLALLVFFGVPARRRRWLSMLGLLVFFVSMAAIGCGGGGGGGAGGGGSSNTGTTAGDYVVTVTATSGSLTSTSTVSLIVQ